MRELSIPKGVQVGVTSDTHWNHRRIIAYCERPWLWFHTNNSRLKEVGEPYVVPDGVLKAHDDFLVDSINAALGPDDYLLHAGDVCWNGLEKLREFRDRLRVKNIYVAVGNHDSQEDLAAAFGGDRVAERWMVHVDGPGGRRSAVLDHFPGYSWEGSHKGTWQLFGHVHGKLDNRHVNNPQWLLSLDVGVDSHNFEPWLWHEELLPLFDSRMTTWRAWRDQAYATPKEKGGMKRGI